MKSLKDFLKRISSKLLLTPRRIAAIGELDPSHIYVENVRALFGVSTGIARRFCEFAVRQGVLQKRVEVRCPDQTVVADAPTVGELPPTVQCWEERDGSVVQATYETPALRKSEFYVLRREGVA